MDPVDKDIQDLKRKLSKGHALVYSIMQQLFDGAVVETEHHIGERLMLDIYCPKFRVAAEYHGRQHFEYVEHFHGDAQGFRDACLRDERKLELCEELGIALVVFTYKDELTEDLVYDRLLAGLKAAPPPVEEPKTSRYRGNPYYEQAKQRNNEWRRQRYRDLKDQRKSR